MNLFSTLQHLVPQHKISEVAGRVAGSRHRLVKKGLITGFAKAYNISLEDYKRQDFEAYESFNDFFTRELSNDVRVVDDSTNGIACPADGSISQIGQIAQEKILQAKGRTYDVGQLLASHEDGMYFADGSFATVYLAPSNYHRVHVPIDGTLIETRYVPGTLFSVNDTTAQHVPDLFARNERLVCIFERQLDNGESYRFAVVMVGAMIVAGIETVATGKITRERESYYVDKQTHNMPLNKGDELGRFYLGSTAIVVMPKAVGTTWLTDIQSGDSVQMGQLLGNLQQV